MIGVNFGRVGFLASITPERLEADLARVFAGEYRVIEQPTLAASLDGETFAAVNDVVAASSTLGRMIELELGDRRRRARRVSCDGMICSTPSGSTAYNLSNGGPVLVRGLDAMAITFIAPHSLDARPLVVRARRRAHAAERDRRRRRRGPRRRPPERRSRARRRAVDRTRRAEESPRHAARDDVLQPLPRDVHGVGGRWACRSRPTVGLTYGPNELITRPESTAWRPLWSCGTLT